VRLRHTSIYAILLSGVLTTGCAPGYVLRAGWEEAQILWRREKIEHVISNPRTEQITKDKLELVADAREFAVSVGLNAGGSFAYFTELDRKVLVWVLTAAPRYSLKPHTWWFPIVGNVPYKGYFDKEDAIKNAKEFQADGYDAAVRPSLAFSTLGWFDDPMLSTMFSLSENDLVDTVIHELVHNTVWAPNHVAFNESLANVAGGLGAVEYYRDRLGEEHAKTILAKNLWADQLRYAKFLDNFVASLEKLYDRGPDGTEELSAQEIVTAREELFAEAKATWDKEQENLLTKRYRKIDKIFNNASLIGARLYLTQLDDLVALYNVSGGSLEQFIPVVKDCISKAEEEEISPFEAVVKKTRQLAPSAS
jgi:predicted aminopeptidase